MGRLRNSVSGLRDSVGDTYNYPLVKMTGISDYNDISSIIARPDPSAANFPSGLGGNAAMVISVGPQSNYDAQLAFGFGSDKIAIRRRYGSTTWGAWKYFTAT